ncbi:hypothetical protein JXA02_02235 [candidate division KSB1 bacterium]|nr:hypothetical protein [candidate division KSB1 bacterium]RQW10436.1 MAG: hypothetical protein EH222_02460 [candidate division KSB1 bacterium]
MNQQAVVEDMQAFRKTGYSLASLVWLLLCDCADQPTAANQIWEKERTITADFPINGLPALALRNYYGGCIIYGHYNKTTITLSADCRVQTTERAELDRMLSGISIPIRQLNDTVAVHVEAPIAELNESYSCGLVLFIPYDMPVRVDYAKNDVITNELDSLVYVRNAQSHIALARHGGSVDLRAQSHINLDISTLPTCSLINARTDSGDIQLVLPGSVDAIIDAKSFYHPIELFNIDWPQKLTSHYVIHGRLGSGGASIHLETVTGIIRIIIN